MPQGRNSKSEYRVTTLLPFPENTIKAHKRLIISLIIGMALHLQLTYALRLILRNIGSEHMDLLDPVRQSIYSMPSDKKLPHELHCIHRYSQLFFHTLSVFYTLSYAKQRTQTTKCDHSFCISPK